MLPWKRGSIRPIPGGPCGRSGVGGDPPRTAAQRGDPPAPLAGIPARSPRGVSVQSPQKLDVVLRHPHRAGEKMFVDFAGQTIPIVDCATGQNREASIFVAALGASNFTYLEGTLSQDLSSWIDAHCRAFEFFGGAAHLLVPDNTKTAVTRACRYEPALNRTYEEMAAHYGTVIIPARPRKPRD